MEIKKEDKTERKNKNKTLLGSISADKVSPALFPSHPSPPDPGQQ